MTRGSGLFVGWYDADPSLQPELDRWHSEEHMRERTGLPGFLSAQRYLSVDRPNRYCVLYRTEDVRTFVSKPYLDVLNNPTDWTRKMMPGVRNLNRTLCVVTRAIGDGFGQFLHTTQFSPAPSEQDALLEWIDRKIIPAVASQTGIIRLELAVADKAASRTKTNEQDLRDQPDAVADWVLLAEAFEETALGHFDNGSLLSDREIRAHGGRSPESETFRLAHLLVSG